MVLSSFNFAFADEVESQAASNDAESVTIDMVGAEVSEERADTGEPIVVSDKADTEEPLSVSEKESTEEPAVSSDNTSIVGTDDKGEIEDTIAAYYNVSFEIGKGIWSLAPSGEVYSQSVEAGEKVTRPTEIPRLAGYEFVSWGIKTPTGVVTDFDFEKPITSEIVLAAKWKYVGWDEGKKHYYKKDSRPAKGIFKIGSHLYIADSEGNVQYNKIFKYKGKKYYVRKNGRIKIGPFKYKGTDYVSNSSGVIKFGGFVTVNGKKYYARKNGKRYIGTLKTIANSLYCFSKSDGHMLTGKFRYNGRYYVARSDGKIRYNKLVTLKNGKTYCTLRGGGIANNGFYSFNRYKTVYYFNKKGVLVKTPIRYNGKTIRPNKKTGAIDGKKYFKAQGYGTTYVLVDIEAQTLTYVKDWKLILSTPVITGNTSLGRGTRVGSFRLMNKIRSVDLVGADYRVYVRFWMPFDGQIGMHDASWHNVFGGDIYKSRGSHGCVNMPYWAAKKLYNNISVGTRVIVK